MLGGLSESLPQQHGGLSCAVSIVVVRQLFFVLSPTLRCIDGSPTPPSFFSQGAHSVSVMISWRPHGVVWERRDQETWLALAQPRGGRDGVRSRFPRQLLKCSQVPGVFFPLQGPALPDRALEIWHT